jgi:hypothetical protein
MSTLKLGTIATQDGTESTDVTNVVNGTAKAWVNFNGTGTVAIRRSFNVSSITDLNTGWYQINFTTSMPDSNFSVTTASDSGIAYASQCRMSGLTTTYVAVFNYYGSSQAGLDASIITVAIHR